MSYQFDPRPEGLHYLPMRVNFLRPTIWYLVDGAPTPWIDLRSLCEAVGSSWIQRWRGYFQARKKTWELEGCVDIKRRETMLVQASRMLEVLAEMEEVLMDVNHLLPANKLSALRLVWRAKIADMKGGAAVDAPEPVYTHQRKSSAARKITPFKIRQMFKLKAKGHPNAAIGKALGVSAAVVQKIANGRYGSLSDENQSAWDETFGGNIAAEPNTGRTSVR